MKMGASATSSAVQKKRNYVVWQKMQNKGRMREKGELSHITGGLTINAKKVVVETPQNVSLTQLAKNPEHAWLKELQNDPKTTWKKVGLAHKKWNHKSQGLTPAGAALISLAVCIATAGTGTAAAPAIAGAASKSVVGITGSAMAGSIAGTMASAGFTTLTTQASISVLNNRGNMERVLQELGSRQNIRALAISMATAGLTEGFLQGLEGLQAAPAALTQTGAALSEVGTAAAASQTGSIASQAASVSQTVASQAASLLENIENFATQTLSNVRDTLQRSAATAGVTAGIATLTGDLSPGEAVVQGLRTAGATLVQTVAAGAIGDAQSTGAIDPLTHIVSHGISGAIAGTIFSNDPLSGAIGAMAAELVADVLPASMSVDTRMNLGRAAAAIAATVTGQDVNLAIHTGTIAAASSLAPEPLTFLLGEPVGEGNALTPSQRTIQGVLAAGGDEGDAALIVTNPLFQDILSQGQAMTGGVITINLPPLPGIRANETSYSAPQVQHHKLVQIFLDASNFVADVHRENPRMAELAVAGLQVALTGPWSMLKSMAQEYVLGNTIEVFKGAASQFVANKLNIAQEYAELATNGAFMGVCFVFGNSKQVLKVAEDVQKSVGKNSKFYMTYYKEHPNKKPYWGITSGKGDITNQRDLDRALKKRDRNHHMNEQGFGDAIFDRASKNPAPIRGREQLKIEQTGGAQSKGGNSSNKNNSIRDGNPKKDHYIGEARKEFGDQ